MISQQTSRLLSQIAASEVDPDPSTFVDNIRAGFKAGRATDITSSRSNAFRDAYEPILETLNAGRLDAPTAFVNPYGRSAGDPIFGTTRRQATEPGVLESEIWREIQRRREAGEKLEGIPQDQRTFEEEVRNRTRQRAEEAQDVMGRTGTLGTIGAFIGQLGAQATDPVNVALMPLGSPVTVGVLKAAAFEASINVLAEMGTFEQRAAFLRDLGMEEPSVIATVATAAAFGAAVPPAFAALGAAGRAGVRGTQFLSRAGAAALRAHIDRMSAGDVVKALEKGPERPAAPVQAAIAAARREQATAETQPTPKTPAGTQEHVERLAVQTEALAEAAVPELRLPEMPLSGLAPAPVRSNLDGPVWEFDPRELLVDAERFQFKTGGDQFGVLPTLQGIERWEPERALGVIAWEDAAGARYIVDGHQRVALARRLIERGVEPDIRLYGTLWRETDGVTADAAMVRAALKNIAEGTGTLVDAARVLRREPEAIRSMPLTKDFVRTANDLSRLSDEGFMMAVNDVVAPHLAAIVGRLVAERELHGPILGLLAKLEPANVNQAESIVRQAQAAGATRETQQTLFGEELVTRSLYAERAKVLDAGLKRLKRDRTVFATLSSEEGRITEAGNVLDTQANAARKRADDQALAYLQALAHRAGHPIAEALNDAARHLADTNRLGEAVDSFVEAVRRGVEGGHLDSAGRGTEVRGAAASGSDAGGDAAAHAASIERLEGFDEPHGAAVTEQADIVEAEVKAAVEELPQPEPDATPPLRGIEAPPAELEIEETPIASPDDLSFERAERAYAGISMTPDKRARQEQMAYVEEVEGLYEDLSKLVVNEDQRVALRQGVEEFRQGYLQRYGAVLDAKSRTMSPMVTGPSKFPTERNQKRLATERKRLDEFLAWRDKAKKDLRQKILGERTAEQVSEDDWNKLRKGIDRELEVIAEIDTGEGRFRGFRREAFANGIARMVEAHVKRGDPSMVERALDYLREAQKGLDKPAFTEKHRIWRALDRMPKKEEPPAPEPVGEFVPRRRGIVDEPPAEPGASRWTPALKPPEKATRGIGAESPWGLARGSESRPIMTVNARSIYDDPGHPPPWNTWSVQYHGVIESGQIYRLEVAKEMDQVDAWIRLPHGAARPNLEWLRTMAKEIADDLNARRPVPETILLRDDVAHPLAAEPGAEGLPQLVLPGAERSSAQAIAARQATPGRTKAEQRGLEGTLFDPNEAFEQMEIPVDLAADEAGELSARTMTTREILDEIEEDRAFIQAMDICNKGGKPAP